METALARPWTRLAAAALSGVMLAFAHAPHPVGVLAWIAPIPLLLAAYRAGAVEAALLALAAGALQAAGSASYYATVIGPAGTVSMIGLFAVLWVAAVSLSRLVVRRGPRFAGAFAFALAWPGIDIALIYLSPHGAFGSLATSQVGAVWPIQMAAIGGVPAISFLLCLPASIIAAALQPGEGGRGRASAPALAVLAVCAAFCFGRLALAPAPVQSLPVGLAVYGGQEGSDGYTDSRPALWDAYLPMVRGLAGQGARLVLLPEAVDTPTEARAPALAAELASAAEGDGVFLAASFATKTGGKPYNRAWVFTPQGRRVADYEKHHPAPGEPSAPGQGYASFDLAGTPVAVAICKDLDFPDLARHYGREGTRAMVVPAWDFVQDDWLHARMAMMRGVETGQTIIRSARDGIVSISDPYGRVVASAGTAQGQSVAVLAKAPIYGPIRTLYTRIGDVFGFGCVALLAAGAGLSLIRRKGS